VDVETGGILITFILIYVWMCVRVLSSLLGLSHAEKSWILYVDGCV